MGGSWLEQVDLSRVHVHECWVSRDWRGRKTMQMGCTCPWDEDGNPAGGEHAVSCPRAGAHRHDCDGTCDGG